MSLPNAIKRPFQFNDRAGTRTLDLVVRPGYVVVHGIGEVPCGEAERLSAELKEAATYSRVMADLERIGTDPASVCTRCGKKLREGIATTQDVPGRWRHVEGSPECSR